MKAQAKLFIPVHVISVLIAYSSSERPDEPAHSRISPDNVRIFYLSLSETI